MRRSLRALGCGDLPNNRGAHPQRENTAYGVGILIQKSIHADTTRPQKNRNRLITDETENQANQRGSAHERTGAKDAGEGHGIFKWGSAGMVNCCEAEP